MLLYIICCWCGEGCVKLGALNKCLPALPPFILNNTCTDMNTTQVLKASFNNSKVGHKCPPWDTSGQKEDMGGKGGLLKHR